MGNRRRTVKFLRILAIYISVLLGVGAFYAPSSESADIMQVPSGQQVFASCAKVLPYLNTDPSLANPIGVGTVAAGGNAFDLKIGLNSFSGPVDIYFGLQDDNGNIYILHPDGSLQPFAKGFVPWKSNVDSGLNWDITQAISGSTEIPVSSIPPGSYTLYLVVTPTGDPGSYYLWQTSFSSTYPFVVSPSCIDLGSGSSSQASIAFVNTSADSFSYQGKSQTSAGDTPSSYNIGNNSCAASVLNSGGWCSMDVTFTPGTSGKMIATFASTDSAAGTEINIPIVFQSEGSSPDTCSLTISSTGKTFPAAGGTGSFSVTSGSGCSWTATSSDSSWLHVTSGSSSAGNAVDYSVDQNTGTSTRTATINVGDQTFTVTQDASSASSSSCQNPSVSPISVSTGSAGGTYSVSVTTAAGCSWGASVSLFSASWITITTGKTYTGSATVSFSVAANSGSRTGYLTVDGKSITVKQQGSGCSYSVSPGSKTVGTSATSGSLTITAGSNCPWTVESSDPSWLTVTSSVSGTGNGTVSYSVAADTSSVERTASIFVQQAAGTANLSVTQDPSASGCNYSLSSYSASVAVSGVSDRFSVTTTGSGCTWTATSSDSNWLHVTSGSSGSGNGAVSYTVDANTGPARTATIKVADQTFTVNESGTAPPTTNGSISYLNLVANAGWTYSGNGPDGVSFYEVTMPAGDSTMQVGLAGEVPQAWNNDMVISDTDFVSQSNALNLYNYFLTQYGYNGPETYALEYPSGSGSHYWFKFASNSESEGVQVNNATGTYYIMIVNTTQNGSLWGLQANAY